MTLGWPPRAPAGGVPRLFPHGIWDLVELRQTSYNPSVDAERLSQDVLELIDTLDADADIWRRHERELRVRQAVELALTQAAGTDWAERQRSVWDEADQQRPEIGSLSRGDVLRIRLAKLVARELPIQRFRDLQTRARLKAEVRTLVERHLGEQAPSPYLDPG